jgi:membrane protein DedA with SNARE-associated domain
MLYYAAMAAAGSVLGCLLVDVLIRRYGEEGLEKFVPRNRLQYVENRVRHSAAWALILASLMPPPFPFTPFIAAAAALQYPRRKLLSVVGAARMIRFTAVGVLALLFGRQIMQWAKSPYVVDAVIVLLVICLAGSILSVISWVKRSRGKRPVKPPLADPTPPTRRAPCAKPARPDSAR